MPPGIITPMRRHSDLRCRAPYKGNQRSHRNQPAVRSAVYNWEQNWKAYCGSYSCSTCRRENLSMGLTHAFYLSGTWPRKGSKLRFIALGGSVDLVSNLLKSAIELRETLYEMTHKTRSFIFVLLSLMVVITGCKTGDENSNSNSPENPSPVLHPARSNSQADETSQSTALDSADKVIVRPIPKPSFQAGLPLQATRTAAAADPVTGSEVEDGDSKIARVFSCRERKEFYGEFWQLSPTSAILASVVWSGTRIIFFSENHSNVAAYEQYPRIFEELKRYNPEINCIFLELPNEYASDFKTHSLGEKFLKDWAAFEPINKARQQLLDMAKANDIQVIPIDLNESERGNIEPKLSSVKYLELILRREKAMADRIIAAMKGGWFSSPRCKMAIMPVGVAHLSSYIPIFDKESKIIERLERFPGERLPELVARKKINSVSVHVLATWDGRNSDSLADEWKRPDCQGKHEIKRLPEPGYGFHIFNPQIPKVPLAPVAPVSLWSDFIAAIVVPHTPLRSWTER